jgi:hypothetical protein
MIEQRVSKIPPKALYLDARQRCLSPLPSGCAVGHRVNEDGEIGLHDPVFSVSTLIYGAQSAAVRSEVRGESLSCGVWQTQGTEQHTCFTIRQ